MSKKFDLGGYEVTIDDHKFDEVMKEMEQKTREIFRWFSQEQAKLLKLYYEKLRKARIEMLTKIRSEAVDVKEVKHGT